MAKILTRQNGKQNDDEYYTRMEDVEALFHNIDLVDIKVYCPCDTADSNIVKYLQEHGAIVRYTIDDYYGHPDLYSWADIVITNPPFTGFTKWYKWMRTQCWAHIVIAPSLSMCEPWALELLNRGELYFFKNVKKFQRPDGTYKHVHCMWVSNFPHSDFTVKEEN